jgi:polyisoprenoid-binding protein YceI
MQKSLSLLAVAAATLFATGAQAETVNYTIEPTHTFVTFEIGHFGASTNRGRFDKKEGSVQLDRAAKTGKVDVTFQVASVNTGTAPFDTHIKSKDILNAEAHPTARFVGDQFTFNGDKVSAVGGQLTLLGKTLPVTLKANGFGCYNHPMLKKEVCGGDFETTIKRSQFGVDYGLKWGFPDDVRLVIQVEAVRQ